MSPATNAAATRPAPVICLEFNELTPWLTEQFIESGQLPNFQRLRDQSVVGVTDAEASGEWLNPWVQWVTIHSGLAAEEHGVFRLSNAAELQTPAVWDLASQAGKTVWVCGSMNAWYQPGLQGHLLPDPWSQQVSPFPSGEFEAFYKFAQKNVQEYAASKVPVSKQDSFRFVKFLLQRGMKLRTALGIVQQLIKERLGNHRWRRASVLDDLQTDVFAWYYKKHRPQFSTLFLNSTAHYQHKFWRNMQPEAFEIRPSDQEQRDYKDAILFGYQQMDRVVGRVLKLAPEATILLLTGLGQQPFTKMEATGGKRVFRLHGEEVLRNQLQVPGDFSYEPIMADQFFLRFQAADDAQRAAQHLRGFQLANGKEAFTAEPQGKEVICQCRCRDLLPGNSLVTDTTTGRTLSFEKLFYRVDCVKSGFHHPDGIFWMRLSKPQHGVLSEKIPLTNVAPTLLDLLQVEQPEFMRGTSILQPTSPTSSTLVPEREEQLA